MWKSETKQAGHEWREKYWAQGMQLWAIREFAILYWSKSKEPVVSPRAPANSLFSSRVSHRSSRLVNSTETQYIQLPSRIRPAFERSL